MSILSINEGSITNIVLGKPCSPKESIVQYPQTANASRTTNYNIFSTISETFVDNRTNHFLLLGQENNCLYELNMTRLQVCASSSITRSIKSQKGGNVMPSCWGWVILE